MSEDPSRCYEPGYAAGATLRRAAATVSETVCEDGLWPRLESWAASHFARIGDRPPPYDHLCREHFGRGFRDGYWGRTRLRTSVLERVA